MLLRSLITFVINVSIVQHYAAAQAIAPSYDRVKDVIYGRSWGTSLTMDMA